MRGHPRIFAKRCSVAGRLPRRAAPLFPAHASATARRAPTVRAASQDGAYLDGGKTYKLSVPQPVPQKLFWSVTVYDSATRSQIQTDQDKAALRSLVELKNVATTGATDLYFGPTAPAGKEGQWIKTNPGNGWLVYFRLYGPDGPAFDGTWKPGDFEEMK